jgi:hypothetical protein
MTTRETLDQQFLEMRWRVLSLAADLDRLERTSSTATQDARLDKLQRALAVLLEGKANRAQQVQMIFSDTTPPPAYGRRGSR